MTSQENAVRSIRLRGRLALSGAALLFVVWLVYLFAHVLGHDQISYLFEAERMLDGAKLYGPHLSETNPPIIIWFSALPVLAAGLLHGGGTSFVWSVALFRAMVVAMLLGSVAWSVRILGRRAAAVDGLSVGLLGFSILVMECNLDAFDFGQREHLLILLLLPYLLAVATGAYGRLSAAERCALGIAAGLAIWFKPHDVLIPAMLELFVALRLRSLRRLRSPELLAMVATSVVILTVVRLATPLYFTATYPVLVDTYWALGTATTLALAKSLTHFMLLAAAIVVVCLLLRRFQRDPGTTLGLLVCSFAASFAYDLQHVDWPYHAYPHRTLLRLALAFLVIDLMHPVWAKVFGDLRWATRGLALAGGLLAVVLVVLARNPRWVMPLPHAEEDPVVDPYLAQLPPGTTVYVFSTRVQQLGRAYSHHLTWGSRFAHLWMLPAVVKNEGGPMDPAAPFKRLSPERTAQLAGLLRAESAEDLRYWHPSVVLVERCTMASPCQALEGRDFDTLAWFRRSPEFAASWAHYREQPGLPGFSVYTLVP